MTQVRTSNAEKHELIIVEMGGQAFAIDIMAVREIRSWSVATPLPRAPAHVLGMINLRGVVLPVIDFGALLGQEARPPVASSVVVVAEIAGRQVGLMVDAVCDILSVDEAMVQPAQTLGALATLDVVRGVVTLEEKVVTLLTLDAVLPPVLPVAA